MSLLEVLTKTVTKTKQTKKGRANTKKKKKKKTLAQTSSFIKGAVHVMVIFVIILKLQETVITSISNLGIIIP